MIQLSHTADLLICVGAVLGALAATIARLRRKQPSGCGGCSMGKKLSS